MRTRRFRIDICAILLCVPPVEPRPVNRFGPRVGFVAVNDARLRVSGLGRARGGPQLILIHGLGDDPHVFGEIAPLLVDRFHVIAYSRRGTGSSDVQGPYDTATSTEDLRGLMDALGILKASLAGSSAGGNEITSMAGRHPDRIERVVYLDAAYDGADPDFKVALEARPKLERPAGAMASLAAFRAYELATRYPGLGDARRVEAYQRARLVIQADGSVQDRVPGEIRQALYDALLNDEPRDYKRVTCAALVISAERYYSATAGEGRHRAEILSYEEKYWAPFQMKSLDRMRRELAKVERVRVPGAHNNFLLLSRQQVVEAMKRFLMRKEPG